MVFFISKFLHVSPQPVGIKSTLTAMRKKVNHMFFFVPICIIVMHILRQESALSLSKSHQMTTRSFLLFLLKCYLVRFAMATLNVIDSQLNITEFMRFDFQFFYFFSLTLDSSQQRWNVSLWSVCCYQGQLFNSILRCVWLVKNIEARTPRLNIHAAINKW